MIDFNRSGDELIQENKAKKPAEYFENPEVDYLLKRAQDAFEERQYKRQLKKDITGEIYDE